MLSAILRLYRTNHTLDRSHAGGEDAIVPDPQVFAIYSRKSKFTGKGESIENQIEMCRQYIARSFGQESADSALVYEDGCVIIALNQQTLGTQGVALI